MSCPSRGYLCRGGGRPVISSRSGSSGGGCCRCPHLTELLQKAVDSGVVLRIGQCRGRLRTQVIIRGDDVQMLHEHLSRATSRIAWRLFIRSSSSC